jgi:hypothetical protein
MPQLPYPKQLAIPSQEMDAGFFQIQEQAHSYLAKLLQENVTAYRVLWHLIGQTDKKNKVIADQTRLGKELALHRNTVSKAVAYLNAHFFLRLYKAGTTNGYELNAWVIWRDVRSKQRTAFYHSLQPGVVIQDTVSSTENAMHAIQTEQAPQKPAPLRKAQRVSQEQSLSQAKTTGYTEAEQEMLKGTRKPTRAFLKKYEIASKRALASL